jgi:hypothetical protein
MDFAVHFHLVFCASSDNAAILNFDFNLYDKILSYYTVLNILQIQMCFYNLLLRQVCSSGSFNMRCEL